MSLNHPEQLARQQIDQHTTIRKRTMSNSTTIGPASQRFGGHALNIECQVLHLQSVEPTFVADAPDLWAEIDAIAATVPSEAWDALPKDYSARADEHIYGSGK